MIIMAIGAGVSAAGMVRQGKAQEQEAKANARLTQNNALQDVYDTGLNESIAEANEREVMLQAQAERDRIKRQAAFASAKVKGQLTRQGLDIGSVSFADVLSSTIVQEREAQYAQLRYEAAVAGQGYRMKGAGFARKGKRAFTIGQFNAGMLRNAGATAKSNSYFSAAGELASGLGSAWAMGT